MSVAGRALYRINRWREGRAYQAILRNGDDVFRQKLIDDEGRHDIIIDGLHFRDGPTFTISDGSGSALIFTQHYPRVQYSTALRNCARTIIDVGANIGLFSYYARLHAPNARIIAIEADPDTFAVLDLNLKTQNIDRLHQAVASVS